MEKKEKSEPEIIFSPKMKSLQKRNIVGCKIFYDKKPYFNKHRFKILEQNETGIHIISRFIGYSELAKTWIIEN